MRVALAQAAGERGRGAVASERREGEPGARRRRLARIIVGLGVVRRAGECTSIAAPQLKQRRALRKAALALTGCRRLTRAPASLTANPQTSPSRDARRPHECPTDCPPAVRRRPRPSMAEPPPPTAPAEPQPAPAEPDSDCARPSSSHGEPEATTAVKDFDPAAPDDPVPQEDASQGPSREGTPPPLPPRPRNLTAKASTDSFRFSASANGSPRPTLQSKATTALSIHDVQSYSETLRDVIASPASRHFSFSSGARPGPSTSGSETGDATSVKSYVPTLEAGADVESILGEVMSEQESSVWRSLGGDFPNVDNEAALFPENPSFRRAFEREFDELEEFKADGSNEGQAVLPLQKMLADGRAACRGFDVSMEIQIEALPNSVLGRKAHIQPPR